MAQGFHVLFEYLAFILAAVVYWDLRKKSTDYYDLTERAIILIAAAIGALIGSRALAWLEHYQMLSQASYFQLLNTKTIVGGLIFGHLFVEVAKYFFDYKRSSGDSFYLSNYYWNNCRPFWLFFCGSPGRDSWIAHRIFSGHGPGRWRLTTSNFLI